MSSGITTRPPAEFNAIADFLAACGARPLPPPGHGHPPELANPADMS
jgi:hypothetical protein